MSTRDERSEHAMTVPYEIGTFDVLPLETKKGLKNVYTFAQSVNLGAITTSGTSGAEVDGAFYFYLGQLDNATAIQAFFDQWRILQVSVSFEPIFNVWASTTTGQVGLLVTALDYDDATSTASSALRQKESCVINVATQPVRRTVNPHSAVAAYSGSFASYANIAGQWLDSASPNVQHYGVKYALYSSTLTSTNVYNVMARYVIQCRQVL